MTDRPAYTPLDEAELDVLFRAARGQGPDPSADLLSRIMADAEGQLSGQSAPAAPPATPGAAPGWMGRLLSGIGGWPAAAGLAAAGVTGLTIGILAPATLETLSGGYLVSSGYQLENLVVSYADLLEDG